MSDEHVILVDHTDNPIGAMEKLEAHKTGVLHRAFSVFVFNKEGELMLQQRALHKYHSPGLWTNTCCSHPRPKEKTLDAAKRRLQEEMGFTCELSPAFSFIYKATFDNGLTEHELDHVFIGYADITPDINPDEVADWSYQSLDNIKKDIALHPENYTFWFKHCFEKLCAHIEINN